MTKTGSCLCKAVKYEFDYEPTERIVCYCATCQKIHAAPFAVNMMVPATEVRITAGGEQLNIFNGTHVLGFATTVNFCKTCGTTMYKTVDVEPYNKNFAIPSATLDADGDVLGSDRIVPLQEGFLSHKPKWMPEMVLEYASAGGSK